MSKPIPLVTILTTFSYNMWWWAIYMIKFKYFIDTWWEAMLTNLLNINDDLISSLSLIFFNYNMNVFQSIYSVSMS